MSGAPSLPAQTPGVFAGAGGEGAELFGECAETVADCGLSPADLGPFEEVIAVVRAAHDRCRAYDQARALEEHVRSFATEGTRAQRSSKPAKGLRRPTARERFLSTCVAAPLLSARFFQVTPGDARTTFAGASAYDLSAAPAAPQRRGLTPRLGAYTAVSMLRPELVGPSGRELPSGTPLDADRLRRVRDARIRELLEQAQAEDEPRLRSTNLMDSRRPRQMESERRMIEQVLPEPPQLAQAVAPTASGASGSSPADDHESGASMTQRHAEGCIAAVADAQERAMRVTVSASQREESAEEAADSAREARDLASMEHELSTRRPRAGSTDALLRAAHGERDAEIRYGRACVDETRCQRRHDGIAALSLQATDARRVAIEGAAGRMMESRGRRPEALVTDTALCADG